MECRVALHNNRLLAQLFKFVQPAAVVRLQGLGYFWVHTQHEIGMFEVPGALAHLYIDLVAHSVDVLHESGRFAIWAWRADGAFERLLHALAGNRHQSKVIELKNFRWRPVSAQGFFQRLHYFLSIAALVHVDEVYDDDAAQVAQANLAHDFFDRVHVGLDDGVFQARRLADIFPSVHVDRDQRFGLIDDDVAATLEPDFRLQGLINFIFESELLEQRSLFAVQLHSTHDCRLEAIGEAKDALVFLLGVNPD